MFCAKCGQEIEAGRGFCRFCGAPVLPPESAEALPYVKYTVGEPAESRRAAETQGASGPLLPGEAQRAAGPLLPGEPRRAGGSRRPSESRRAGDPRRPRELLAILLIAFLVVACAVAGTVAYLALRDDGKSSNGASAEIVTDPALDPDNTSSTAAAGTEAGGPDTSTTATVPADTTTSEGPDEPADLSLLAVLSASSVLAAQGEVDYEAKSLVDGDPSTCWAEGATGYGLGEYVEFAFPSSVTITALSIVPGYDKSLDGWDRWTSNGRVRSFVLVFSDGTSETYSVTDTRDPQTITLSAPRTVTWVRFVIDGVYEAEEGPNKAEDTSVSELHFWGTE